MTTLIDTVGVLSALYKYRKNKTASNAKAVWDKYDRQVDKYALDKQIQTLTFQHATLTERMATTTDRRALLRLSATRTRLTATERRRLGMEAAAEQQKILTARNAEARALIGIDRIKLDGASRRIAAATDVLIAERTALEETSAADLNALNAQVRQLAVERGLLDAEQAQKIQVYDLMEAAAHIESLGTADRFEAQQQVLRVRLQGLGDETAALGIEAALARQEIAERTVIAAGAAAADVAARTGGASSFSATEQQRLAREERRQMLRIDIDTRRKTAGLASSRAELDAQRVAQISGFREARAGQRTRMGQIGLQRATAVGEWTRGRVGLASRAAGLGAQRARTEHALLTGRKRIGERAIGLDTEREALDPQERALEAREQRTTAEAAAGRLALEERRAELGFAYHESVEQAAFRENEADKAADDVNRMAREREDAQDAKAIAEWQKNKLNRLPFSGSSRGGVALLLNLAAQGLD